MLPKKQRKIASPISPSERAQRPLVLPKDSISELGQTFSTAASKSAAAVSDLGTAMASLTEATRLASRACEAFREQIAKSLWSALLPASAKPLSLPICDPYTKHSRITGLTPMLAMPLKSTAQLLCSTA